MAKKTTLNEVGEMLAHVVKHMATKDDIASLRTELKADIVRLGDQVHSIEQQLRDTKIEVRLGNIEQEIFGKTRRSCRRDSSPVRRSGAGIASQLPVLACPFCGAQAARAFRHFRVALAYRTTRLYQLPSNWSAIRNGSFTSPLHDRPKEARHARSVRQAKSPRCDEAALYQEADEGKVRATEIRPEAISLCGWGGAICGLGWLRIGTVASRPQPHFKSGSISR
jgi:hypothetical protein